MGYSSSKLGGVLWGSIKLLLVVSVAWLPRVLSRGETSGSPPLEPVCIVCVHVHVCERERERERESTMLAY